MAKLEIDLGYRPRPFQALLHRSMKRFNVLVLHRRAGKTVYSVNELVDQALRCKNKNPQYAYIAPTYTAAKRIVWDMMKEVALKIPGATANEAELRIDIPRPYQKDKIKILLLGAENPAAIRGIYLDGVILDEAAFMSSELWTSVVRPALVDREGWALFISTPNGENWFYDLWKIAEECKNWFRYMLKASESGLVPIDELEAARSLMSESEYAQEFECSFAAALVGAYWGKEMEKATSLGRITSVPYDPILPVHTFWDLGIDDSTAIWFCQKVGGHEVRLIDYLEGSGEGLDFYAKELRSKGYNYAEHNLPHDAAVRELGSGKTRQEILRDLLPGQRVKIQPKYDVADSINAARLLLAKCWFDKDKCDKGISALRSYQRAWDRKNKVFQQRPKHDWASHASDAFRYLAMGIDENRDGMDAIAGKLQRYQVVDYDLV